MKRSFFYLIVAASISTSVLASEPSAFGAGNLNSATPYGLTTTEKEIYSNKQNLEKVTQKTSSINTKIDSLRERIDGLQTVLESVADKSHKNTTDLNDLLKQYKDDSDAQKERNSKIDALIDANTQNIEKLKQLISDVSALVDKINANYVTKDEFNNLVQSINDFKKAVGSKIKSSNTSSLSSMKTSEIYNQAYKLYQQKSYDKALKYYDYLVSKKYKPAFANYMMGEISYKQKHYGNAIAYFKTSATLYDKASYMPNLMLHTGLSMKYTKDSANAKKFLNALISAYPSSDEAKVAKKNLKDIK